MAKRGAPIGNNNAGSGTEWREALRAVTLQYAKGDIKRKMALRKVAEMLLEKALEGDLGAIKELGDRFDGKSAQSVSVTGADGSALLPNEINVNVIRPKES